MSRPTGGTDASALVTRLPNDSGRGPWWRRPLRFDADATRRPLAVAESTRHGLVEYQG